MVDFFLFFTIIATIGVLAALFSPDKTSRNKLIQCDLCPQMCKPDGYHLKRVPEGIGDQRRHNVHMYRKHAKKEIIQGSWQLRQAKEQHFELERLKQEIDAVPLGEEFLRTLDKN